MAEDQVSDTVVQVLAGMLGGGAIGWGCRMTIEDRTVGIVMTLGLVVLWCTVLTFA